MIQALDQVTAKSLIFLRHLQQIEIQRNGKQFARTSIAREDETLRVSRSDGDLGRWLLLHGDAAADAEALKSRFPTLERLSRDTRVTLAFPIGTDTPLHGVLYAYLPTEQLSGLPCHINADFFPEPNRRAVVLSAESMNATSMRRS
jgi:hypothetical protein